MIGEIGARSRLSSRRNSTFCWKPLSLVGRLSNSEFTLRLVHGDGMGCHAIDDVSIRAEPVDACEPVSNRMRD